MLFIRTSEIVSKNTGEQSVIWKLEIFYKKKEKSRLFFSQFLIVCSLNIEL